MGLGGFYGAQRVEMWGALWLPLSAELSDWLPLKVELSDWLPLKAELSNWLPLSAELSNWLPLGTELSDWLPLNAELSDWLLPAGPAPFAALPFLPQQPPGGAFGLHGPFPAPTGEGRGLKGGGRGLNGRWAGPDGGGAYGWRGRGLKRGGA